MLTRRLRASGMQLRWSWGVQDHRTWDRCCSNCDSRPLSSGEVAASGGSPPDACCCKPTCR